MHSLVYAWKEKLLTGEKLTRISTYLGLKYRLGLSYTMECIAMQIVHICRLMDSGRLAQYRIALTNLID